MISVKSLIKLPRRIHYRSHACSMRNKESILYIQNINAPRTCKAYKSYGIMPCPVTLREKSIAPQLQCCDGHLCHSLCVNSEAKQLLTRADGVSSATVMLIWLFSLK